MPLFFTVAGWAQAGSVLRREVPSLLAERSRRLLLPLVLGCATFGPFIGWVQYREIEEGRDSFVAFVPPLAIVQICLRGRWPGFQNLYDDWANFTYYSLFLWAGFLLARVGGAEAIVERSRRTLVGVGLAAAAPLALLGDSPPGLNAARVVAQTLSAISAVGLVAGAWGYARKFCNVDSGARRYLTDAAFPVYVLHQPAIVALALLVVHAAAATWWGLPALIAVATIVTLATYEFAVRRSPTLQYALGTRPATKLARRSRADDAAATSTL